MRILFDTCVIIDALQNREPFCKDAQELILLAANNTFIGCITAKSVTDIYYLSHHYTHSDKTSREILNKIFAIFEVLDTDGIDCRKAVLSPVSDYEDAVMIETALRNEMDCIVTRNEADYTKSPIPIYSSQEFLDKLKNELI